MIALYFKELNSYLSSLTGYLVILLYLLINGLFLWVFDGGFNIPDSGYASIQPLFVISPWVFMFLIPAITMRMFSDERRLGTLEFLFTKPLNETKIILAKYFAALSLVIISILPTLVYFFVVYAYAEPQGNVDVGGSMGSYLGLIFLGAAYSAIGLFASALTENQIVSFLIGLFLCFFMYTGFESLANFDLLGGFEQTFVNLGISVHFSSMSRGVIDTRDAIYFISLSGIFILATRLKLVSRKWV